MGSKQHYNKGDANETTIQHQSLHSMPPIPYCFASGYKEVSFLRNELENAPKIALFFPKFSPLPSNMNVYLFSKPIWPHRSINLPSPLFPNALDQQCM